MLANLMNLVSPSERVVLTSPLSKSQVTSKISKTRSGDMIGSVKRNTIELRLAAARFALFPRLVLRGDLVETPEGVRIDGELCPSALSRLATALWFFLAVGLLAGGLVIWGHKVVTQHPGFATALSDLGFIVGGWLGIVAFVFVYQRIAFAALKSYRRALLSSAEVFLSART